IPALRRCRVHRRRTADHRALRSLHRRLVPARQRAMAGARPACAGGRSGIQRGERMNPAEGPLRVPRPQRLALVAGALVVLAAIGSVLVPQLRLSAALLALPVLLGLLALVPLAMLFAHLRLAAESAAQAQRVAETQRIETERNQQAIMRLLDEMSNLAEGDLTVQATVTEDITGAIADSVNYAVEALRKLVTTISQSGIQLDGAARQTQALASH